MDPEGDSGLTVRLDPANAWRVGFAIVANSQNLSISQVATYAATIVGGILGLLDSVVGRMFSAFTFGLFTNQDQTSTRRRQESARDIRIPGTRGAGRARRRR